MKKLTKKLGMSTLALASVFALGFSAVNTVASNNVSTQASVSAMAYEGDIDSTEGVEIINVTLPEFTIGNTASDTKVTGATMTVTATAYNATNQTHFTNYVNYRVEITMPTGYVYEANDEDAFQVGVSSDSISLDAATNTNSTWSNGFTHNANGTEADTFTAEVAAPRIITTWNFALYVNDSDATTMNNEKVGTSTNTDGQTMELVYSTSFNSWEYDSTLVANPQFAPYFVNKGISVNINNGSLYDATLSYTFELHMNGYDYARMATGSTNQDELSLSGVVYIPYIDQNTSAGNTFESTYKGYLIDVGPDANVENAQITNQTEGQDTFTTNDDVYEVTMNLDLNNMNYMIVDNTYNIGYNLFTGTYSDDTSASVTDSITGDTVQNERVNTVQGSILWADAYTATNTPDVDMDGNGYVDQVFGGNNTTHTTITEGSGTTTSTTVFVNKDINYDGNIENADSFTSTGGTANYARYNTMDISNIVYTVSLGSYEAYYDGTGISTGQNSSVRVLSQKQYAESMEQYNDFVAGNPWGLTGTNTAITAIVLASIFGVTTIGIGAYIVVNNNKAKKAKAHTSTTHSHDKK